MEEQFSFDVFLSHSSKDKAVVRAIAERLQAGGLKVCFNDPARTEDALALSRVLVLCMSANAFGSDWPRLEAGTLRFRDPLNHERSFIPLRLDDTAPKGSLAQFLWIDWRAGQGYERLLEACRSSIIEVTREPQVPRGRLQDKILSLGHTAKIRSVALGPDGTLALSGSDDKTVRLWDVETGRCLRVLEGHSGRVLSVAWSPDGRRVLSGAADHTILLWDAQSGRSLRVLEGHHNVVRSVAWSPNGQSALSASVDRAVRLWDVETGNAMRLLEGHTASVLSVAWSPDGRHALSGSFDQTIRLWDVETERSLRVLKGHSDAVWSVAWSPDGRHALSCAADKTVRLWYVETGSCLRVLEGHSDAVASVAWSLDGRRALSCGADNTVRLWDLESGRSLRVFEGHSGSVLSVAWSSDGRRVLSAADDKTVRLWDVETGCPVRILEGHSDSVSSVAWSADGRALSGADDKTARIWDVETGTCLHTLEGHSASVLTVAWSPDGRRAFSGAADATVAVWDAETGPGWRALRGHSAKVLSVACSPDGRRMLSGSHDNTVRLWMVETGLLVRVLEGHSDSVWSVAWSPDGRRALSGSHDNTVRLWDVETGRILRVLEGHSNSVLSVAWSPDGRRALSGGDDHTVRLWDVETGRCLHVLEGHSARVWSVAWSPDGRRAFSIAQNGVMRVWDLADSPITAEPQVQYSNAKVLLVGDTGVGKSGLAERLVHRQFVPTKSSHARKAHVLENHVVMEPGGVSLQQETVLWDLAGQPAYRLVNQLSMEDATLACVLFDSRSETNPFEGAAYWSNVLDQARTNTKLKKVLVASRIDVGGLPAGRERIEAFAREHNFVRFIPTSAGTGEGCDELLEAIHDQIPWDEVPKVTTTTTLADLRDYVARLKSQTTRLLTIAEMHEGYASWSGEKIRLDEFIAHLQRLEATDDLDLLIFHTTGAEPRQEHLVLLDPTRVDSYASALLVAAKDEPDGPGHLLESRVREGKFKLDPDERIADPDSERHVLWHVMESLLSRDLALREQIKGEDYVVFPSQCTAELRFPGAAVFGVAFGFAGPVRSIYATLIAQLAHYEGFTKREFFQDAAAYFAEAGGRCLVRLRDRGRGQGELEALFDRETPAPVRQGFLAFVRQHLESRGNPGSVSERHAYHCANPACLKPFDDGVVKARLEARKKNLLCPYCEEKTPLVNLLATPTAAAESVAARIGANAKAGRQSMTAALVIKAKEAQGKFDVFLSHNAKDKPAVEKVAKQLLKVGIRPWLDKWNLAPGDTVSEALERAIQTIPCAALCFGPADTGKWHIMEIRAYVERWAGKESRLIPVILPGAAETPELPVFVRQTLWVDLRDWENDQSDGFYRLVCGILGKAPGDTPMKKFRARDVAQWQGER